MTTIGAVFINDRDLEADFLFYASALPGWPGNLSATQRDAPLSLGPQMQGGTLDPRLIVRKPATATIVGIMVQPTADAARIALDNLRALLWSGAEVKVRTFYAPDRYCMATCVGLEGVAHIPEVLDGSVDVTMSFQIKSGVAFREQPDGYALSTTPTPCPIGSAESRPVIVLHGNGAAMANPGIVVRNAAGDVVQRMDFTGTLAASEALRIDTARGSVTKLTDGTPSDALAAGWWPPGNGDFPLLRPFDGNAEAGQFPSVAVSGSGSFLFYSVPVGDASWALQPNFTRTPAAFLCSDGVRLDLVGDSVGAVGFPAMAIKSFVVGTTGPKTLRFRIARSVNPCSSHVVALSDGNGASPRLMCYVDFTNAAPIVKAITYGKVISVVPRPDGGYDITCQSESMIVNNGNVVIVAPAYNGAIASVYVGNIVVSDALTPVGSIAYTRRYN